MLFAAKYGKETFLPFLGINRSIREVEAGSQDSFVASDQVGTISFWQWKLIHSRLGISLLFDSEELQRLAFELGVFLHQTHVHE